MFLFDVPSSSPSVSPGFVIELVSCLKSRMLVESLLKWKSCLLQNPVFSRHNVYSMVKRFLDSILASIINFSRRSRLN